MLRWLILFNIRESVHTVEFKLMKFNFRLEKENTEDNRFI